MQVTAAAVNKVHGVGEENMACTSSRSGWVLVLQPLTQENMGGYRAIALLVSFLFNVINQQIHSLKYFLKTKI